MVYTKGINIGPKPLVKGCNRKKIIYENGLSQLKAAYKSIDTILEKSTLFKISASLGSQLGPNQ